MEIILNDTVRNEADNRMNIRPVEKKQVSLNDQWSMLEKIDRELRERIRREKQEIIAEYDRNVVDTEILYAQKIGDTVAQLEAEKKSLLRDLADTAAAKLRDHELLLKRM